VTFGFELVVSSAEVNTESVSLAFKLHCWLYRMGGRNFATQSTVIFTLPHVRSTAKNKTINFAK
jgi:hypothetical protein